MKKRILLILSTVSIICFSCHRNKEAEAQIDWDADEYDYEDYNKVGKYIYLDDNGIYHTNSHCLRLMHGKDMNGHEIYGKQQMDTANLIISDKIDFRVCVRCVDDSQYELLKSISDRNVRLQNIKVDRKWLYNMLVKANYNMGTYEEFVLNISDPKKRQHLYQTALEEGWNVGSFDEFSMLLGFDN